MKKQVLSYVNEGGIAIITLHRPEVANALSVHMLTELRKTIEAIHYDKEVRTVIVTGAGEKAFCAGADLKERLQMDEASVRTTVGLVRETINELATLRQPVIAAINGVAFGGGLELALACDLRIATSHALFGLTETSLGIIPGAGGTQRLPRLIGIGRAKELIFTAKKITAHEAEKIGLVERVVAREHVLEEAKALAQLIIKNGPIALAQAKLAINDGCDVDVMTGLAIEANGYEVTIGTKDRLEGLQAFKEKRPPIFTGE